MGGVLAVAGLSSGPRLGAQRVQHGLGEPAGHASERTSDATKLSPSTAPSLAGPPDREADRAPLPIGEALRPVAVPILTVPAPDPRPSPPTGSRPRHLPQWSTNRSHPRLKVIEHDFKRVPCHGKRGCQTEAISHPHSSNADCVRSIFALGKLWPLWASGAGAAWAGSATSGRVAGIGVAGRCNTCADARSRASGRGLPASCWRLTLPPWHGAYGLWLPAVSQRPGNVGSTPSWQ